MKNYLNKIKIFIFAHKVISTIIVVIVLGVGYWGYQKITSPAGVTRYVTTKVATGTIISSIADSGQVSALNQISVTPQVSGILTAVYVKPGDSVRTGQTLFVIDNTSAEQAVRDAQIGLQNANLALQKLQLQNSTANLDTSLSQSYDNAFTAVSNTFLDLPTIQNGITTMFFTSDSKINGQFYSSWYASQAGQADQETAQTYEQTLTSSYTTALAAYNKTVDDYKTISRNSDNATIDSFISETYETTKLLADVVKNGNDYIDFVNTSMQKYNFIIPTIIATHKASLNTYTSEINSHLSDLLSAQTSISTNKDAFQNSDLSTQSTDISIQQAKNTLLDAQQNLSKYNVTAPFDGVISSVPVITGDNAGSGTTLATLITTKDLATVTLSEVDVAKIALGDQATLTFNAIPDLTIAGQVVEIDSVGTVSSGVVNYNVQISFDATSDGGVKPGMSVNAAIITAIKQNVLIVPNGAIKTTGGVSRVQTFPAPLATPLPGVQGSPSLVAPTSQTVTIGISNDTSTEIVSGLNEGDIIVTKTIAGTSTATTATTTSAAPSILGTPSGRGGGAIRIGG